MTKNILFICILLCVIFLTQPAGAGEKKSGSQGQTIYVPAYSHIYIGNAEKQFLLTVTLSIRNIDLKNKLEITAVDYFETQGKFLKHFIDKPTTLGPMESLRYIIPEKDKSGGSGANFIVKWASDKPINPPIVETIMIGARSTQGISFTSRGQEIF